MATKKKQDIVTQADESPSLPPNPPQASIDAGSVYDGVLRPDSARLYVYIDGGFCRIDTTGVTHIIMSRSETLALIEALAACVASMPEAEAPSNE